MLYKFKSKATGDLIMLEQHGSQLLRTIGKEPSAKGILLCADMPAALQAITEAIARCEALARETQTPAGQDEAGEPADLITLRQRAVPFMDMLRRCITNECDVVWGV
jgi:cyclopropane-fatty-acyl-phospholipid synthase